MKLIARNWRYLGLAVLTVLLVLGSFLLQPIRAASTYTIKLGADNGSLAFQPNKLTIKPGDTIEWVVNKVPPHNFVFESSNIVSQELAASLSHKQLLFTPGQKVSTTFPTNAPLGVYTFYCIPHRGAGMVGKITVE